LHKKTKILISLFFIFTLSLFIQTSFSKYIVEDTFTAFNLDIDRCKPNIELLDITTSNELYPTYANKTHTITGHFKLIEKNIIKNNLNSENIKFKVNTDFISPNFINFSLISETTEEKIYEFSFTNTINDGNLNIVIPEGIIEDKSSLINEEKNLFTGIVVDNTLPVSTFNEIPITDNKSKAEIKSNELIRPITGWNISDDYLCLSKDFSNCISYTLPVTDFAENQAEILIDIKNVTKLSLEYGTYDDYSKQTIVSNGQISAPDTISSNSVCKSEVILMRLLGDISPSILQGRAYVYTPWGDTAYSYCGNSELIYYHGYNPKNNWLNIGTQNQLIFNKNIFSQLGGRGLNVANAKASNVKTSIPKDVAAKYPYGISSIQFQLKDCSEFSVVYQSYVKDIGWIKASYDGEENLYQYNKPISAFRINLVPKTDKQYLINYWNRDVSTNNVN